MLLRRAVQKTLGSSGICSVLSPLGSFNGNPVPFRWFANGSTLPRFQDYPNLEDIPSSTEDQRIVTLSRYVMNSDLKAGLRAYSELPLFLPRSDFRIVCGLMEQLGKHCGVPDIENAFMKIQRMKLTRKHALTFRCLIRAACELRDTELIERFYTSICEEEVYVNNSFLNDVVVDSLFSLDAYPSLCHIFDSMQILLDNGQLLPSFNNHASQSALTAFIAEGRDDLVVFFLQHIKRSWRIPVVFTDYIISNASRYGAFVDLFDRCVESQPKSATLMNAIIHYYVEDGDGTMAIQSVQKALDQNVKVTSVSFKEVCELLVLLREENESVDDSKIRPFCDLICALDRGGYVVALGLVPLEMMMGYGKLQHAKRYIELLGQYENGLTRRDVVLLEDMKKSVKDKEVETSLSSLILLLNKKYAC